MNCMGEVYTGKWEVNVLGTPDDYFEISVVRADFKYGFKSFGGTRSDRKLEISSGGLPDRGYDCDLGKYVMPQPIFDMLVEVAGKYAEILNESK